MAAEHGPSPHCPPWCVVRHAAAGPGGPIAEVHLGGTLMVQHTLLRLRATGDPLGGTAEGPVVMLGSVELSLHEAEALIAALTQLVDEGRDSLLPQQP